MHKILIRPEAKEDIYTTELGQAIDSLVDNPEIGFTIDHVKDGYRLFRFRHHFVIYTLSPRATGEMAAM